MKTEVLMPEHAQVMAEHPGLNQRQWWLVSDLTERLAQSESRRKELYRALSDLMEQIDCLDGIEYTKDLDRYKAEAIWDDVIRQAQDALSKEPK